MTKDFIINEILKHPNYAQENIFKKHFPEEYDEISKIIFPDFFVFKQKLYHYLYNDLDFKSGKCYCGKFREFRSFAEGYKSRFCSHHCAQKSPITRNLIETTCIAKYGHRCSLHGNGPKQKKLATYNKNYGTDNPAKSDIVKRRAEATCDKRYGKPYYILTEDFKIKSKLACLRDYGTEYYLQSKDKQIKSEKTCLVHFGVHHPSQAEEIKKKKIKTCNKNHGVDYPMRSEKIKETYRSTSIKNHGVDHPSKSDKVKFKREKTNNERYNTKCVFQAEFVKEKSRNTNISRYGVPYACMRPEARKHSNDSKLNKRFADLLTENDILFECEFRVENYSYDFKVGNILIEIDSTIFHNSYLDVFGNKPKNTEYHLNKTNTAKRNGYFCIHVFDWDCIDKIVGILKPKTVLKDDLEIKRLSERQIVDFYKEFSLNENVDHDMCYGLFSNDVLIYSIMFKKNDINYEITNFCSRFDYEIKDGYKQVFEHFIKEYNATTIMIYLDNSKFFNDMFYNLGFVEQRTIKPARHWYQKKDKSHVVDQSNCNEKILIDSGFLPVYDCGKILCVWKK